MSDGPEPQPVKIPVSADVSASLLIFLILIYYTNDIFLRLACEIRLFSPFIQQRVMKADLLQI